MLGSSKTISLLPIDDKTKATGFYRDVLGLTFVKDDGFALVFQAGDRMLRLVDVSRVPDFKPQPFAVIGWEVDQIAKVASGLKQRGVTFERYPYFEQDELGIWTAPGGDCVAWFKDPAGNLLSISQHT